MENRVYCLYRVSTIKQADFDQLNHADIPMQRNACHEFAAQMGWNIVHEKQETGVSGFKISAENRDKLQLIKNHAVQKKFDILLVFMFDRIGRKADESPFIVEWFVRNGIRVWSVKEGEQRFDQHIDTLLNYIRFWQADGESRKTSIRTKEGLRQLVLSGGYRGGGVPYGYCLEPTGTLNKRKKEVFALTIDPYEATIVRKMFDLCVGHGYGRCRIAAELNKQGITNRKGENWHEATIGHILHNISYTGILRSGNTVSQPFEHLMIIPPEIFEQAQVLHETRKNEQKGTQTFPLYTYGVGLLKRNIFCGHCGGRLVLTSNSTACTNALDERVRYKRIRYICYQKTRHRCKCDGQTGYTAHILEKKIERVVLQLLSGLGCIEERFLLEEASLQEEELLKQNIRNAIRIHRDAKNDYELLKHELQKALRGASAYPSETLAQILRESEEKVSTTLARTESLRNQLILLRRQKNGPENSKMVYWADIYRKSPTEVKRMITCYLLKKIYVFRNYELHIEINDIGVKL